MNASVWTEKKIKKNSCVCVDATSVHMDRKNLINFYKKKHFHVHVDATNVHTDGFIYFRICANVTSVRVDGIFYILF
jgi:hypothetical protein